MNQEKSLFSDATRWKVESETGVLRDVLMCKPDHFAWLPTCDTAVKSLEARLPFDPQRAITQHHELSRCIEDAGVRVHWMRASKELPDLCWTRDSSHMTPWGALITRLSEPVRIREHQEVEAFYQTAGHPVWRRIDQGNVEGGDIHFIRPGLALIGYSGVRTTLEGAGQLAAWARQEGWEVHLQPVDSHFVHLDVVFCMATDQLAVVCEAAVGERFTLWLKEKGIRIIPVSIEDALNLGCNLLSLGKDRVIVPQHCTSVSKHLRAEGLEVLNIELDMFTPGGGGVHCLTQPLRRDL